MKYVCLLIIVYSCTQVPPVKEKTENKVQANSQQSYRYQVLRNDDASFGYQIFNDSALLIHQKTIPGRSGNSGFHDSLKAGEVAALVISKLEAGHFPPTVQSTEIDQILKTK